VSTRRQESFAEAFLFLEEIDDCVDVDDEVDNDVDDDDVIGTIVGKSSVIDSCWSAGVVTGGSFDFVRNLLSEAC